MSDSSGYTERDRQLLIEMTKFVDAYKPGAAYEVFETVFGTWADTKAAQPPSSATVLKTKGP